MERKHNKENVPVAKMLRKNMTKEEKKLWYDFLKDYPVRFKRQKPFGKYVLDFYCSKVNLVIEVDGRQHSKESVKKSDKERTEFLESYGLEVLRFKNYQVRESFRFVCNKIDQTVKERFSLYEEKE